MQIDVLYINYLYHNSVYRYFTEKLLIDHYDWHNMHNIIGMSSSIGIYYQPVWCSFYNLIQSSLIFKFAARCDFFLFRSCVHYVINKTV